MAKSLYPTFSILLVDDELPWLRSLSMALEGPGAITNLMLCHDSREVMAVLEKNNIGQREKEEVLYIFFSLKGEVVGQ